ncbi:hypothetical protein IVA95_23590 [Bradyrhizobium sp. 157]|uniref:hypothetical protein n=1 Tax=Bradyrhizobium sp. 157 TaxID=2782631 RepID=UPI001FF7F7FE|nr:hypothetical protein [Bradyrhizobium sp. 157]MCK1640484.1 hypothetical protein [Bradyrhizobium sp. 157]
MVVKAIMVGLCFASLLTWTISIAECLEMIQQRTRPHGSDRMTNFCSAGGDAVNGGAVIRNGKLMLFPITVSLNLQFVSHLPEGRDSELKDRPRREARRSRRSGSPHDISILQRHAEQPSYSAGDIIAWSAHSRQTKSASGSRPHCFR